MMLIALSLLVLVGPNVLLAEEYSPIVNTTFGRFRGLVRQSENGTRVYFYQGIRYGHGLRFNRATYHTFHKSVYNATEVQYACPQPKEFVPNTNTSEDCLFMNIWTPTKAIDERKKLPVMFWIHGGSLKTGHIFMDLYDGRHLAALGDVVVVSVNYRLGPLGFSCFDKKDEDLGFYDMMLGLGWVNYNIEAFGGDRNSVTIFGESAGSISVSALFLEQAFPKYFHRIIMQSGPPSLIAPKAQMIETTKKLAESVGCSTNGVSDTDIVRCLRGKDVDQLINTNLSMYSVFGGKLLSQQPLELVRQHHPDMDMLVGVTKDEGALFVGQYDKLINITSVAQARILMSTFFGNLIKANLTSVIDHYFHNVSANNVKEIRNAMTVMITDGYFKCASYLFASTVANSSKAHHRRYVYRFDQAVDVVEYGGHKKMGAGHGVDLVYVFGRPITKRDQFAEADYHLSREVIQQWSTFAKTGMMAKVEVGNVEWIEAFGRDQTVANVMTIADSGLKLERYNFVEDCKVWQGLLYPH